jgi:anthranilate synthase component 1
MTTMTTDIATDLLTPLGAYLRLRGRTGSRGSFLLESVERGRLGRYSFVGCGSLLVGAAEAERLGEPVVGYLGYDVVAALEPTVTLPDSGPDLRESLFVVPEVLVRFDHARGVAHVLTGDPDEVAAILEGPLPELARGTGPRGPLRRFPDRDEHLRRIERAKEHIREGDVFQVVISQRAERPTSASAAELYRALRRVNPSPYLFLLELDDLALVGSSPETVVKCEGSRAALNPIAGTIAPGDGDGEALLSSEKDRAEHVMLVDLGRNDLSRVCVPGSVRVERFMTPERYSHVTHLVSEVVGELRDGCTPFELLRACFPAGTVSGAPKVRAMQIISELEGHRRGIYAGAVGYVFPEQRELDTCIAIRTLVLRDGVAYLQAGGGIVADSDPAEEHQECLNKLGALEAAIDLAELEQDR